MLSHEDSEDGLDIPEFLKVSAEQRRQAWEELGQAATPPPAAQRELERLRAERKKFKTRERIAALKARKAERDAFDSIPRSERRWDLNTSRWVRKR
jgi:hypothetical protein